MTTSGDTVEEHRLRIAQDFSVALSVAFSVAFSVVTFIRGQLIQGGSFEQFHVSLCYILGIAASILVAGFDLVMKP